MALRLCTQLGLDGVERLGLSFMTSEFCIVRFVISIILDDWGEIPRFLLISV